MPRFIERATRVEAAGNKPKLIDEYVGRVNTKDSAVSVAHMRSPGGWVEPGQTPEFREVTFVIRGRLRVESKVGGDGAVSHIDVVGGQAIITEPGEWVRYSTPDEDGAEYVAICLPAFSIDTVHRDSAS